MPSLGRALLILYDDMVIIVNLELSLSYFSSNVIVIVFALVSFHKF